MHFIDFSLISKKLGEKKIVSCFFVLARLEVALNEKAFSYFSKKKPSRCHVLWINLSFNLGVWAFRDCEFHDLFLNPVQKLFQELQIPAISYCWALSMPTALLRYFTIYNHIILKAWFFLEKREKAVSRPTATWYLRNRFCSLSSATSWDKWK